MSYVKKKKEKPQVLLKAHEVWQGRGEGIQGNESKTPIISARFPFVLVSSGLCIGFSASLTIPSHFPVRAPLFLFLK